MEDNRTNWKANSRATAKYNEKAYDECKIRLPKGCKAKLQEALKHDNKSLNGYIYELIYEDAKRTYNIDFERIKMEKNSE